MPTASLVSVEILDPRVPRDNLVLWVPLVKSVTQVRKLSEVNKACLVPSDSLDLPDL